MTSAIRVRLTSFGLAIGVVAALIAWAAYTTWKEIANLQGFDSAQIASYQVADHLQTSILQLNDTFGDYALRTNKSALEKFWQQSEELNKWIETQRQPGPQSLSESNVISGIDTGYDEYLATASNAVAELERSQTIDKQLDAVQAINSASAKMFEQGSRLEDAHRDALSRSLSATGQSIALLEPFLFGSLFLLLALGTSLFFMIYRDMISPLRVKLIESSVIIERQEKLASLGMLAAGVAHEIRNPLTAIKARLFMQGKRLRPGTPEHADAEVIGQEIHRLERIVKDFLLFARPTEPELVMIPAEQPLRDAQELLGAQLQKANIKLRLETVANLRIRVDPQQLKQVIINLVQNGAESIGENGSIVLRSRSETRVLAGENAPVVILEVSDTGAGIPADVQKRLFDPFFTTKEGGTGLGLCIAARIVQKHGGVLQYQTQVNHGTTFGIVLPLAKES